MSLTFLTKRNHISKILHLYKLNLKGHLSKLFYMMQLKSYSNDLLRSPYRFIQASEFMKTWEEIMWRERVQSIYSTICLKGYTLKMKIKRGGDGKKKVLPESGFQAIDLVLKFQKSLLKSIPKICSVYIITFTKSISLTVILSKKNWSHSYTG